MPRFSWSVIFPRFLSLIISFLFLLHCSSIIVMFNLWKMSSNSLFPLISKCKLKFISPKYLCKPLKFAKLKVPNAQRNPRKGFFKCNNCGFFTWLEEYHIQGIEGVKEDEGLLEHVKEEIERVKEEIAGTKEKVIEVGCYLREVVRIGLFMYVVLVVIVMLKSVGN